MGKEKKEKKAGKLEAPVVDGANRISKKEKKDKDRKSDKKDKAKVADALLAALEKSDGNTANIVAVANVVSRNLEDLQDMLVPFAQPLANEKQTKKVLKLVKKGAKNKSIRRGVKEVVKALRKSPAGAGAAPTAIVILAADISPMDVISHIPVLCEDHGVPYMFVTSRAELGAAGATKRPTSVVLVTPNTVRKKKGKEAEAEVDSDFKVLYDEAVAMIEKAMKEVVHN